MHLDRYSELSISSDALEYKFTSIGPKGSIEKGIIFSNIAAPNILHLAFGNLNKDGTLDDLTVNDNKDRNKILATIAFAVYEVTKNYPDKTIFFSGSTTARNRLYRMAITRHYELLSVDFDISGITKEANVVVDQPFTPGICYIGFLIKRKLLNLLL